MRRMILAILMGLLILSIPIASSALPSEKEKPRGVPLPRLPKEPERKGYRVKVIGKWGYRGENRSAGYFVMVLKRARKRLILVKGLLNTTDGSAKAKFFGIAKRCFLNGVVRYDNKTVPVVGLLKLDRDNKMVMVKWMSPRVSGWAVGRISVRSAPS